jgi:hypothetical protein
VDSLESRLVLSVGGGSTAAGFVGQYFNNTTLSGTPTFTRNDVRIEFNWGGTATPGGSTDPVYSTIGTTNFSVLWTGKVIPNFSETYTFLTTTVGGVQLFIKPDGSSNWTTLVNDWTDHAAATTDSGQFAMTSGQTYDIEMEYYTGDTQPEATLNWSSPSTPQEVIDPLSVAGINVIPYGLPFQSFADEFRLGRDQWATGNGGSLVAMDSNGWPLADAMNVVWEGQVGSQMEGTYILQFQGLANVNAWPTGTFYIEGQPVGSTVPSGAGYNQSTNTTTVSLRITSPASILELSFANSQRTATSPLDTGVTNVHLMRPSSIGATSSYPVGTLIDNAWLQALEPYTVLRDATSVNGNEEANWSDRTLPGYHTAIRNGISMAWEDLVMLSN